MQEYFLKDFATNGLLF